MLRFAPRAWIKLQYLCHAADTEVGAFGIARPDDLLFITDIATVKQECTAISVEFDDAAVADFFETQVEQKRRPEEFARIWIHTHPGDSPEPSSLDEETFERVFGECNWAVMFILACGGETYCRLRVNSRTQNNAPATGSGLNRAKPISLACQIPVKVDYEALVEEDEPFDPERWLEELKSNVHIARCFPLAQWLDLDDFAIDEAALNELAPLGSEEGVDEEADECGLTDDEPGHPSEGPLLVLDDPDDAVREAFKRGEEVDRAG